ncbi:MAG: hypothetical protein ACI8ZM_002786 [Crocinitomix sp.]|jgi:hypothetical protein
MLSYIGNNPEIFIVLVVLIRVFKFLETWLIQFYETKRTKIRSNSNFFDHEKQESRPVSGLGQLERILRKNDD